MNGFFHGCIRASCRKREMLLKEAKSTRDQGKN